MKISPEPPGVLLDPANSNLDVLPIHIRRKSHRLSLTTLQPPSAEGRRDGFPRDRPHWREGPTSRGSRTARHSSGCVIRDRKKLRCTASILTLFLRRKTGLND